MIHTVYAHNTIVRGQYLVHMYVEHNILYIYMYIEKVEIVCEHVLMKATGIIHCGAQAHEDCSKWLKQAHNHQIDCKRLSEWLEKSRWCIKEKSQAER